MKKLNYILRVFGLTLLLISCTKDILDRPTRSDIAEDEFFNSGKDLELLTNNLYSILPEKNAYLDDEHSDDIVPGHVTDRITGSRRTPTKKGSGGWSWGKLRDINYILDHYQSVDDEDAKAKYSGVSRFFRALFYFKKVKRFGDVPWINRVLDVDDEEGLLAKRDSQKLVVDSIMSDINYAIENIPAEKHLSRISKYTALILKARIALYEGTYREYRNSDDYRDLLEEAVSASKELIENSPYELFSAGGSNKSYRELFQRDNQQSDETILAAQFDPSEKNHNISYKQTAPTSGSYGFTKEFINSYLMRDGSRFTDKQGYETMLFYDEMQNRDPRLTQTTAGPHFKVKGEDKEEPVNLNLTTTGYRVIKALEDKSQWGSNKSNNDVIVFRYAEALLIYAEAKAELEELSQADLDMSINKLRDRAGMPHLDMAEANANPDPYQESLYSNLKGGPNQGVILEIRRERRIEMAFEGKRWDDLMRWKEGTKVNKPMVGIYFDGVGGYDFDGDGQDDVYVYDGDDSDVPSNIPSKATINLQQRGLYNIETEQKNADKGNLDPFPKRGNFQEPRDYLFPLPKQDLRLNDNLEQNPGWED